MKDMSVGKVRNFAWMGHTGCGKTTLIDAILFKLGVNDRKGSPEAGTSMCDWTEDERQRKISIWAKPFDAVYKSPAGESFRMVMLDTPGYADFVGQFFSAAVAADAGLIVVDANAGIQVGATRAWKYCIRNEMPRGIVITGLDREGANYEKILGQIQSAWGPRCLPVNVPAASGVVNVLAAGAAHEGYGPLVEAAAETDDTLLEEYLGGQALTDEELAKGLRAAVGAGKLVPVFVASGKTEVGLAELLDGVARMFPSPLDRPVRDADGKPVDPSPTAPFVGRVWRTITDPFIGQLSLVRVCGGTLKGEGELFNVTREQKERVGGLILLNGKKQDAVPEAEAGDIVAIPKLKATRLNDTLAAPGQGVRLPPVTFPAPVTSYAVTPKTKGDDDKLMTSLQRVAEDDPTIKIERNAETHETILSGMGDVQLLVAVENMKRNSHVEVNLATPKVTYKETITGRGEGHYKHKKQTGGRGQYGEVYLRVAPKPPDDPEWFEDAVVGGTIPRNFIPAVEKGLHEGLNRGSLAGCPVVNVKVTVYEGSYHDVDSSEIAFKIAGERALRDGLSKAKPVLLEPIMKVRIVIPDECMGDVTGDLNHKRGRILGMDVEDGMQVILAEAPQAELFQYSSQLRSITGGRGSFEVEFSRMETVPAAIAQRVIAEAQKHMKHDEE